MDRLHADDKAKMFAIQVGHFVGTDPKLAKSILICDRLCKDLSYDGRIALFNRPSEISLMMETRQVN